MQIKLLETWPKSKQLYFKENGIMQVVDKKEVAKRKNYKLSSEVLVKRRRAKDIRNAKRVEMAERVSRANILMEAIRDGTFLDKNRQAVTAKAVTMSNFGQLAGST